MQVSFHFKGVDERTIKGLEDLFKKEMQTTIRRHMGKLPVEDAYFHVSVEKNPHKPQYYVGIALYLPNKNMFARQQEKTPDIAMHKAINSLIKQIERYRDRFKPHKGRSR